MRFSTPAARMKLARARQTLVACAKALAPRLGFPAEVIGQLERPVGHGEGREANELAVTAKLIEVLTEAIQRKDELLEVLQNEILEIRMAQLNEQAAESEIPAAEPSVTEPLEPDPMPEADLIEPDPAPTPEPAKKKKRGKG